MDRTDSKIDTQLTRGSSRPVPKGPHVYFIRARDAVKIGFSEKVGLRFAGLQSGHFEELELLGTIPATYETERYYHERFAHLHIRGEWYRAALELLDAIEADKITPIEPGETWADKYKLFKQETKHLAVPGNSHIIGARTFVLFRLGQLAQNAKLPVELRQDHFAVHSVGLKEALANFDQLIAEA